MYDALIGAFLAYCDESNARAEDDVAWSPSMFRLELTEELTKALAKVNREARSDARDSERQARRAALRNHAAVTVDEGKTANATSILTEDWYSEAPKATGEVQDRVPDEADEELRNAAAWLHRNPEPRDAEAQRQWVRRFEWQFGVSLEDADAVALRTVDEIRSDEDVLSFATRDDAPAPKGYGMTAKEFRRKWYMDARNRYEQALTEALKLHRSKSKDEVKFFPAVKSQADQANAVLAKWRFVDELARHGVFAPDAATIQRLKSELTVGFKPNYANAYMELSWRTKLAERGQYDRYLTPLG